MKRMTLAALAALMTAPMATAQQHSAESVAAAVLTGFLQRDAVMVAGHTNQTNERFFAGVLDGTGEASQLWEADRGGAGAQWDGMILPARYDAMTAIVPFAIEGPDGAAPLVSGVPGRYISVVLTLDSPEDTTWGFEDINYIEPDTYAARQAERP